jgi:hypothetical protein
MDFRETFASGSSVPILHQFLKTSQRPPGERVCRFSDSLVFSRLLAEHHQLVLNELRAVVISEQCRFFHGYFVDLDLRTQTL